MASTKQLVSQHVQLLHAEASANVGGKLPAESKTQQVPGRLWRVGEELLILQGWEDRGRAGKQSPHPALALCTLRLWSTPASYLGFGAA